MPPKSRFAKHLTQDQIETYEEAFMMFDKNGDGSISFDELKLIFNALKVKLSDEQLLAAMKAFDTDGDGSVSLDEFITMMESKVVAASQPSYEEELRQVFAMFDKDGDGSISAAEIHEVMVKFGQNLTKEEIEMMIAEADEDGSGTVDFEEFKRLAK